MAMAADGKEVVPRKLAHLVPAHLAVERVIAGEHLLDSALHENRRNERVQFNCRISLHLECRASRKSSFALLRQISSIPATRFPRSERSLVRPTAMAAITCASGTAARRHWIASTTLGSRSSLATPG